MNVNTNGFDKTMFWEKMCFLLFNYWHGRVCIFSLITHTVEPLQTDIPNRDIYLIMDRSLCTNHISHCCNYMKQTSHRWTHDLYSKKQTAMCASMTHTILPLLMDSGRSLINHTCKRGITSKVFNCTMNRWVIACDNSNGRRTGAAATKIKRFSEAV